MAMTLGSVTVNQSTGAVTKSGVVGRFFDQILAAAAVQFGGSFPTGPTGIAFKNAIASQATVQGTALFNVLTLDASAKIADGTGGLQKTPNPNNANTSTLGPSGDKFLPIV
jgi:hypothetical protein